MFVGQPDRHPDGCHGAEDAEYHAFRLHNVAATGSVASHFIGSLSSMLSSFGGGPIYSPGNTTRSPSLNSFVRVTPPKLYSMVRRFVCPNSGSPLMLLLAIAFSLSSRILPLSSSVTSNLAFCVQYSALRIWSCDSFEATLSSAVAVWPALCVLWPLSSAARTWRLSSRRVSSSLLCSRSAPTSPRSRSNSSDCSSERDCVSNRSSGSGCERLA